MDLAEIKTQAIADAVNNGMTEEAATAFVGTHFGTVETGLEKVNAKLADFDKVVGQRQTYKEQAAANEAAAAKLREIEESGKTDLEKATGRIAELEPKAKALEEKVLRFEAEKAEELEALSKDLSDEQKAILDEASSTSGKIRLAKTFLSLANAGKEGQGSRRNADGSGSTITREKLAGIPPGPQRDKLNERIRSKDLVVVP